MKTFYFKIYDGGVTYLKDIEAFNQADATLQMANWVTDRLQEGHSVAFEGPVFPKWHELDFLDPFNLEVLNNESYYCADDGDLKGEIG